MMMVQLYLGFQTILIDAPGTVERAVDLQIHIHLLFLGVLLWRAVINFVHQAGLLWDHAYYTLQDREKSLFTVRSFVVTNIARCSKQAELRTRFHIEPEPIKNIWLPCRNVQAMCAPTRRSTMETRGKIRHNLGPWRLSLSYRPILRVGSWCHLERNPRWLLVYISHCLHVWRRCDM